MIRQQVGGHPRICSRRLVQTADQSLSAVISRKWFRFVYVCLLRRGGYSAMWTWNCITIVLGRGIPCSAGFPGLHERPNGARHGCRNQLLLYILFFYLFYPSFVCQFLMVRHFSYDGMFYKTYHRISAQNSLFLLCAASAGLRRKIIASAMPHFELCVGCNPLCSR